MATLVTKDKNTVTTNDAWEYNKSGVTYNESGYSYNLFGDLIEGLKRLTKNVVTLTTKDKN